MTVTSTHELPLVSIITVVYNDIKHIESTMLNVFHQTYPHIEYIVIDGGSTDGTFDLIKKHENNITYWISEKDNGIYDAMNKGINVSKGKWLLFLNSGDTLFGHNVLENIEFYKYPDIAVLYGNTWRRDTQEETIPKSIDFIQTGGIHACHQSMLFNKDILKETLSYVTYMKLSGDSELITKIYAQKHKMFYLNITIANYMGNGVASSGNIPLRILWKERLGRIGYLYKYFGITGILRRFFLR